MRRLGVTIVLLFVFIAGFGQDIDSTRRNNVNVDSLFTIARDLSYDKSYKEAEQTLDSLIPLFPEYTDLKMFRIRLQAWEGEHDSVDVFVQEFFNDSTPLPEEAMEIQATSAWWSGDTTKALKQSKLCITDYPENQLCHTLVLKVLEQSMQYDEGLTQAEAIVDSFPNDSFIPDYISRLKALRAKNGIGIIGHYDIYTNAALNRLAIDVEYQRKTRRGPLFVRLTPAQRFNRWGLQASTDFYWTLHEKFYLYLGGAISNDAAMFPIYRLGLEPFFTGLENWEFSLGARYLEYTTIKTWIFTGSVTRYLGDNYFNVRPFFSTRPTNKLGFAIVGSYRRFLKDKFNFLEFKLGYGASPDNTHLDATFVQAVNSTTYNASLGFQKSIKYRWLLKGWVAYEYLIPQGGIQDFSILSLNLGLVWRF